MKTWLITGASTGLGRHLAETVLKNGDQCVLTARQPEQLDDLVWLFAHLALAVPLDVTQPAQIAAAFAAGQERFGAIDVVVNNIFNSKQLPTLVSVCPLPYIPSLRKLRHERLCSLEVRL